MGDCVWLTMETPTPEPCLHRLKQYECVRCGYSTTLLGNYKHHITRKNMCRLQLGGEDVVPCLENARITRSPSRPSNTGSPVTISSPGTANINLAAECSHNTITVNNIQSAPPVVRAWTQEDMSFLTTAIQQALAREAATNAPQAIATLIRLVHYNVSMPENMNIYMPRKRTGSTRTPLGRCFNGREWRKERWANALAFCLVRERSKDLLAMVKTHLDAAGRRRFQRFVSNQLSSSNARPPFVQTAAVRMAREAAESMSGVFGLFHHSTKAAIDREEDGYENVGDDDAGNLSHDEDVRQLEERMSQANLVTPF